MGKKYYYIKELIHVLLHLLFWCAVSLFFSYIIGVDNTINSNVFYFSLFLMPVTIGTTYVSIYYLIPEYLITKRYLLFIRYGLYTLIISAFTILFSIFYAFAFLSNFEFGEIQSINRSGIFIITCVYLVVIIVSAFKLLKLNLQQSKTNAKLKAKFLEAKLRLKEQELGYLKMQIHPHFLFNTLNTLYGFALKKSEMTPDMILKLSNLLDYLLYQTNKPFVDLTEEINHIKDYIALEKMRFNDTLNITLDTKGCKKNISVAPMLFLPFVENSFKHGKLKNSILDIKIKFECSGRAINFIITNSHEKGNDHKKGIGLDNIKKRLELLYKERYNLKIFETDKSFNVQLNLQLHDA